MCSLSGLECVLSASGLAGLECVLSASGTIFVLVQTTSFLLLILLLLSLSLSFVRKR
jgi:preprotein translocase subunit SecG